ncbi:helix-turn-helix transcriptional regulator [Comamonas aquatica]|nr:AlpA family phage regulatory protein [Comamonas aquatica]
MRHKPGITCGFACQKAKLSHAPETLDFSNVGELNVGDLSQVRMTRLRVGAMVDFYLYRELIEKSRWMLESVLVAKQPARKKVVVSMQCGSLQHELIAMNHTPYAPQSKSLMERSFHPIQASQASMSLLAYSQASRTAEVSRTPFCDEEAVQAVGTTGSDVMRLNTILRLRQLLKALGISRSTVYLRINPKSKYYDPVFPKPIRLGAKAVGWVLSDVNDYIEHLKKKQQAC